MRRGLKYRNRTGKRLSLRVGHADSRTHLVGGVIRHASRYVDSSTAYIFSITEIGLKMLSRYKAPRERVVRGAGMVRACPRSAASSAFLQPTIGGELRRAIAR